MVVTELPLELQAQILSYLSWVDQFRCTKVCRLWESIVSKSVPNQTNWYEAGSDPASSVYIHKLFTTPGVECVFSSKGFHINLPPSRGLLDSVIKPTSNHSVIYSASERVRLDSKSPLLDAPMFITPLHRVRTEEEILRDGENFDMYLYFAHCGAIDTIAVPWDYVENVRYEEGYKTVPIGSFLKFLGGLINPDFGLEEGFEHRMKFSRCWEEPPWFLETDIA